MVKKLLLAAVIFLFQPTFGQKDPAPKSFFAVKTDLVLLSRNFIGDLYGAALTFEQGFAGRHSVQLTGSYIEDGSSAWSLIPEYKFFLNKNDNFKSFYAGAYLKYENILQKNLYSLPGSNRYVKEIYQTFGGGLSLGAQTYIIKHIAFDILLGIGPKYTLDDIDPLSLDSRLVINLGYRF